MFGECSAGASAGDESGTHFESGLQGGLRGRAEFCGEDDPDAEQHVGKFGACTQKQHHKETPAETTSGSSA